MLRYEDKAAAIRQEMLGAAPRVMATCGTAVEEQVGLLTRHGGRGGGPACRHWGESGWPCLYTVG